MQRLNKSVIVAGRVYAAGTPENPELLKVIAARHWDGDPAPKGRAAPGTAALKAEVDELTQENAALRAKVDELTAQLEAAPAAPSDEPEPGTSVEAPAVEPAETPAEPTPTATEAPIEPKPTGRGKAKG